MLLGGLKAVMGSAARALHASARCIWFSGKYAKGCFGMKGTLQ